MSDVLSYLHAIVDRVSAVLMPRELNEVAEYLSGQSSNSCFIMHTRARKMLRASAMCMTEETEGKHNKDDETDNRSFAHGRNDSHAGPFHDSMSTGLQQHQQQEQSSCNSNKNISHQHSDRNTSQDVVSQSTFQLRIPRTRVTLYGFIPLAIAASSVTSISSLGRHDTLHAFFSDYGFDKIMTVNFTDIAHYNNHNSHSSSSSSKDDYRDGARRRTWLHRKRHRSTAVRAETSSDELDCVEDMENDTTNSNTFEDADCRNYQYCGSKDGRHHHNNRSDCNKNNDELRHSRSSALPITRSSRESSRGIANASCSKAHKRQCDTTHSFAARRSSSSSSFALRGRVHDTQEGCVATLRRWCCAIERASRHRALKATQATSSATDFRSNADVSRGDDHASTTAAADATVQYGNRSTNMTSRQSEKNYTPTDDRSRRHATDYAAKHDTDNSQYDSPATHTGNNISSNGTTRAELCQTFRVLLTVHCYADSRVAVSLPGRRSGGGTAARNRDGKHGLTSSNNIGNMTATSVRRHRYGKDVLLLLLHEIAACVTWQNIRLRRRRVRLSLAVLLLPEDHTYGGALLKQRLMHEVGDRYDIRLFAHDMEGTLRSRRVLSSATTLTQDAAQEQEQAKNKKDDEQHTCPPTSHASESCASRGVHDSTTHVHVLAESGINRDCPNIVLRGRKNSANDSRKSISSHSDTVAAALSLAQSKMKHRPALFGQTLRTTRLVVGSCSGEAQEQTGGTGLSGWERAFRLATLWTPELLDELPPDVNSVMMTPDTRTTTPHQAQLGARSSLLDLNNNSDNDTTNADDSINNNYDEDSSAVDKENKNTCYVEWQTAPDNDEHVNTAVWTTANVDTARVARCMTHVEAALLRHSACFFLRPHNAALCYYLREALRRFPLLLRPAIVRHWKSTWAVRHALVDVVYAFHAVLMPFDQYRRWEEKQHQQQRYKCHEGQQQGQRPARKHRQYGVLSSAQKQENGHSVAPKNMRCTGAARAKTSATLLHNTSPLPHKRYCRQRQDSMSVHTDTVCILDGILAAAANAMSVLRGKQHGGTSPEVTCDDLMQDDLLTESMVFMLFYEELIEQRSCRHVLRAQPIVDALVQIFAREQDVQRMHRCKANVETNSTTRSNSTCDVHNDEKNMYVRHEKSEQQHNQRASSVDTTTMMGKSGTHSQRSHVCCELPCNLSESEKAKFTVHHLLPFHAFPCVDTQQPCDIASDEAAHHMQTANDIHADSLDTAMPPHNVRSFSSTLRLSEVAAPSGLRLSLSAPLQRTLLTIVQSPARSLRQLTQQQQCCKQEHTLMCAQANVSAAAATNLDGRGAHEDEKSSMHAADQTVSSSLSSSSRKRSRATLHNSSSAASTTAALVPRYVPASARCDQDHLPYNFFSAQLPDGVRVLYLLTAHSIQCRTERERNVSLLHVQQLCQLSDERLLLVVYELQMVGMISVNLRNQTARSLLTSSV